MMSMKKLKINFNNKSFVYALLESNFENIKFVHAFCYETFHFFTYMHAEKNKKNLYFEL